MEETDLEEEEFSLPIVPPPAPPRPKIGLVSREEKETS